jgi:RNA polymerase sigma-70 factor (ECF subfamily)
MASDDLDAFRRHVEIVGKCGSCDAEDIVHDVILLVIGGTFDDRPIPLGKGRAFLRGVLSRMAVRRAATINRRQGLRLDEHLVGSSTPPVLKPGRRALRKRIGTALLALPKTLRKTWIWRHLQGRSTAEIADLEGVTPAAVRQRLLRARSALSCLLRGQVSE